MFGFTTPVFADNSGWLVASYYENGSYRDQYVKPENLADYIMNENAKSNRCTVNLNGNVVFLDKEIYLSYGNFKLTIKNGTIDCQNRTRAFYLQDSGIELDMQDLVIKNGNAYDGGAIYINDDNCFVHGVTEKPESVKIQDCYSYNCGGAIRTSYAANETVISNITFINNDCYDDGGAILNGGDGTQVVKCVFKENESEDAGGAIYAWDTMTITACEFDYTNKSKTGYGHDVYCYVNDVVLLNNNFKSSDNDRVYNAYKNVGATTGTFLSSGSLLEVVFLGIIAVGVVAIYVSTKRNALKK